MAASEILPWLGVVWIAVIMVPIKFEHRGMALLLLTGVSLLLLLAVGLGYAGRPFS
jgi:hypothetical protein